MSSQIKMEKAIVTFWDKAYAKYAPQVLSPVDALNRVRKELNECPNIKAAVDGIFPAYQITQRTAAIRGEPHTLDDIVKRQRANSYLSGKNVVVICPDSDSSRLQTQEYVAFPFNLGPKSSLALLIALKDGYKTGQIPLLHDREVPYNNTFALDTQEEKVVTEALKFISERQSVTPSSRILQERELLMAAERFMREYRVLRGQVDNSPNSRNNFVLMLAYVAAHRYVNEMFGNQLFEANYGLDEFQKPKPVEVDVEKPRKVFSSKTDTGLVHYIKSTDLIKWKGNIWKFITGKSDKAAK